MKNIVFLSRLATNIQQHWLTALNKALPNESIYLPEHLSHKQMTEVDIAIVANPDPSQLTHYPNLLWVQSLWAGIENILPILNNTSIKLVKLNDQYLANTMAESVLAWTLYLQRHMPQYRHQQLLQQWQPLKTVAAKDLTVSILGAGNLGKASLSLLNKLGYRLNCWSKTPKSMQSVKSYTGSDGLDQMLGNTDVLISLLPLTPATSQLLDHKTLSKLKKGANIINFSRGAIIETAALINLLDSKHLNHAVLDVFTNEPLPSESSLWLHPNITILPHISAPTDVDSTVLLVADNINRYRDISKIPAAVDVNQGY
jgi:glyoxylate/hydroxypyruvate reductase A